MTPLFSLLTLLTLIGLALWGLFGLQRLPQDRQGAPRAMTLPGLLLGGIGLLLGLTGLGSVLDLPAGAPGLYRQLLESLGWLGLGGLGGYLFLRGSRRQRRLEQEQEERQLLELIAARGGRVTAVELAKDSPYSLAEVEALLRRLCEQGAAELLIGRDGQVVYRVPGFLSPAEKEAALQVSEFQPQASPLAGSQASPPTGLPHQGPSSRQGG
jgi:hypothetical protein